MGGGYQTTIDRAGRAIAAGSVLGGLLILALLLASGQRSPAGLLAGGMVGALCVAVALTAVAGPIWLALHACGFRRGCHAAWLIGLLGLGLFAGVQGHGTGLFTIAPIDTRSWLLGLAAKTALGIAVAAAAAGIGIVMWRIAYSSIRS